VASDKFGFNAMKRLTKRRRHRQAMKIPAMHCAR
jgi:hypothetical protein